MFIKIKQNHYFHIFFKIWMKQKEHTRQLKNFYFFLSPLRFFELENFSVRATGRMRQFQKKILIWTHQK